MSRSDRGVDKAHFARKEERKKKKEEWWRQGYALHFKDLSASVEMTKLYSFIFHLSFRA